MWSPQFQELSGYELSGHAKYQRMPSPIDSMDKASAWLNGYDIGIRYADRHVGMIVEEPKRQRYRA
jgi:choline-sulfatase